LGETSINLFTLWAIVYFGNFKENYRRSPLFSTVWVLIWTKIGWATLFFKNSSGHPALDLENDKSIKFAG
jgi:hypothetical protein